MRTVPVNVCLFVSVPDRFTDENARGGVMAALAVRVPDEDGRIYPENAILGQGPLVVSGASLLTAHGEHNPDTTADVGTADPIEAKFI